MPKKPPIHRGVGQRGGRQAGQARPKTASRGYGWAWQKYRKWFLSQPENAFCLAPGCGRMAQVVDHIRPHKGDQELFWDQANHQPLCKRCHDCKTARGE